MFQPADNKTIHRSAHFFLSSISYNILVTIYRPTPPMASIEDLIATISGGLHAGQQGNDIRDLHVSFSRRLPILPQFAQLFLLSHIPIHHALQEQRTTSTDSTPPWLFLQAKLAQTINNPLPPPVHRPIPPCTATAVSAPGMPPPAPASSWNTPPPNTSFLFSTSPLSKINGAGPGGGSAGRENRSFEVAHHVSEGWSLPMSDNASTNFTGRPLQSIVPNNNQPREEGQWSRHRNQEFTGDEPEDRPYHASVLPIKASPKDTGGFAEDAFKPLWEDPEKDQWQGFKTQNR